MKWLTVLAAVACVAGFMAQAAPSSAAQNLYGMSTKYGQTSTNRISTLAPLQISLSGTGTCTIAFKVKTPDGKTVQFAGSYKRTLPTSEVFYGSQAGINVITAFTIASADTPACPAGQQISLNVDVFNKPSCPPWWEEVYQSYNPLTGAISCMPAKKYVTCAGKTQYFYSSQPPSVCSFGCEDMPQ